jgi:initiation factor 1A
MVRNLTGGNKNRSQARKNVNAAKQPNRLRLVEEDGEIYAQVIKLYGGGRCLVYCNDKIERNCVIRGKFKGKNKRHNMLSVGTIIIIGIREDEKTVCDLLYVYNEGEKSKLYNVVLDNDWKEYKKNDCLNSHITFDDELYDTINFVDEDTIEEYKHLIDDKSTSTSTTTSTSTVNKIEKLSIKNNNTGGNCDDEYSCNTELNFDEI